MKYNKGFSLIELMVAGLIGTFLMLGLMNLFITTNKSITLSDGISQNQETGRFAMDYMTKFVRLAGYSEDFTVYVPPIFTTSGVVTCAGTEAEACAQNDVVDIRGDRLAIAFVASGDVGSEIRTCTGTLVGGPLNGQQSLVNVFWVSAEPDTDKELRCRTYSRDNGDWLDAPVSIVDHVENMQFQIGIADPADPTDKRSAAYVSVDQLADQGNTITQALVRSIRISILTTSSDDSNDQKLQSNKEMRRYAVLDGPLLELEDGSIRNIFTNTIELPNAIETAQSN